MAEYLEIWGVNDPNISAQLVLADKLDLFKREVGLHVSCKFIELGTTMADDIMASETHPFAVTQTPITALQLREKGVGSKIVAPLADVAGAQQMIVRKASGISAPQDLYGKRIGIVEGAAVCLALRNMAHTYQLDLHEMTFVNMLPDEQLQAFKAGELDAMASWEPWTSKARMMGGEFYFSGVRSAIPGFEGDTDWLINQSCLIVPDEYLVTQSENIIAIINVLQKTTELMNHHREDVSDTLAEFFDIHPAELLRVMRHNHYSLSVEDTFQAGIVNFRDYLYDTGQISARFAEDTLYDTQFLQQVAPHLVQTTSVPI